MRGRARAAGRRGGGAGHARPRARLSSATSGRGGAAARALEAVSGHTPRMYVHLGELLRAARRSRRGGETMAGARRRGRASACAARSATSCSSTAPTTWCGSAAGTRPRPARGRRAAGPRRHRRARCTAPSAGELYALRGETDAARAHLEPALELAGEGLPGEFVGADPRRLGRAGAVGATRTRRAGRSSGVRRARRGARPALHARPARLGVRAEADLAERARAARRGARRRARRRAARGPRPLPRAQRAPSPDALAHRAVAEAERSRVAGRPEPARVAGGRRALGRARRALSRGLRAAAARRRRCSPPAATAPPRAGCWAPHTRPRPRARRAAAARRSRRWPAARGSRLGPAAQTPPTRSRC